jgi:AAA domain-containing protein
MRIFAEKIAEKRLQREEDEKLREVAKVESEHKAQARIAKDQDDIFAIARDVCDADSLLADWEFTKVKKGLYISPNSNSNTPGFHIQNNKWFSHHESDVESCMGSIGKNDKAYGDISDLIFFFENDNNRDIVFLADFVTGKTDAERKREYARLKSEQTALEEFTFELANDNATDDNSAKSKRFSLISSTELTRKPRPNDWLIKGIFESNNYGMIFGQPASGKSLIALQIGFCIATGQDWNGKAVTKGKVAYIAGEGFTGLSRRMRALELHYGLQAKDLYFSEMPAALTVKSSAKDVAKAIDEICPKPVLIIIDTLHRNFGGGDENSAQDFGSFTNNIDNILRRNGETVLIVHHTGHGDQGRSRGSSSIKAALDVEYSVFKNDSGIVSMSCTKAKDFDPPADQNFKIIEVDLGWDDEDGETITGVVVEPVIGYTGSRKSKLHKQDQEILDVLADVIRRNGEIPNEALKAEFAFTEDDRIINIKPWREACYPIISAENANSKRKAFNRAYTKLRDLEKVQMFDDYWWVGIRAKYSEIAKDFDDVTAEYLS